MPKSHSSYKQMDSIPMLTDSITNKGPCYHGEPAYLKSTIKRSWERHLLRT